MKIDPRSTGITINIDDCQITLETAAVPHKRVRLQVIDGKFRFHFPGAQYGDPGRFIDVDLATQEVTEPAT